MKILIATLVASVLVAGPATGQFRQVAMKPGLLRPHLVEVEAGRRLNLRCSGSGSPTVVFEQGGEGMIFNWAKVQPAIAAVARTCFYDRGGFGWSDPPRYPVTATSVTDDLHRLLRRGGVQGPIVLVGHSIGGFYSTMYADRFLPDLAGLVLVDPGFSGQTSGMQGARRDVEQANLRRGESDLLRCAELARSGKLSAETLRPERCYSPPSADKGDAARRYAMHAITGPHWYLAEHSQSVSYIRADDRPSVSQQQELDAQRSFGDLPVRVLSAERFASDPWRTDEENKRAQMLWLAGHANLARRSSRGHHEIVAGAGHFIQRDRPEAVIEAITDVLAQARSR